MSGPLLSVVLPTRDRLASLKLTLAALARQQGADGAFEAIVADDGSQDETPAFLAAVPPLPFPLRSVRLQRSGPAAARNRAIAVASAPRVLLLGDDTLPRPDALAQHLAAAGEREVGIQGRIEWYAGAPITPVMRFLAPDGPQFYFRGLDHGRPIPYTVQYGANLSAPLAWFRDEPFDERLPAAAFEDTELAYRWHRRGRQTLYWATAVCEHHHHYGSIKPFLTRQRTAGQAARLVARRHPGLAAETILLPLAAGAVFAVRYGLRRLSGRATQEDLWDLQSRAAFVAGLLRRDARPGPETS